MEISKKNMNHDVATITKGVSCASPHQKKKYGKASK